MGTDVDTGLDPGVDTGPAHTGILGSRVEDELRAAVLGAEFGVRERLTESGLARRFGVSRTPVRAALAGLVADGLLTRLDGAYYVAVPDLAELRDLYELRVTLELRGIARAMEDPSLRHDPAILAEQHAWWSAMRALPPQPGPGVVLLDERFHAELSRAAGNRALTAALTSVNAKIRRIRMYDFLTADRVQSTVAEHLEILDLLQAGELDAAHRALHVHVGESLAVVRERASEALTHMTLHGGLS
ncbi:GntR family transcriptional regulator [Yinghuangia soli]|uniref:GntR family transcriptional regulator n=1 Tax=Yinghuangia soli TaxID=2908204 RepID=A0AA41QA31_9ACTN|nr:GntR family transcriptional regulator [Yinghuangia soli]MCF2533526.1 GntR family transcriptional regulator [Yinghuangia soli]